MVRTHAAWCVASNTPQRQTALRCPLPLPGLRATLTDPCTDIDIHSMARITGPGPVAWSAEPMRLYFLNAATDNTSLLACRCFCCSFIGELLPKAHFAKPSMPRLSRLGRFVVGLAPPCSRRLGRGWGKCNESKRNQYGESHGCTHTAGHGDRVERM